MDRITAPEEIRSLRFDELDLLAKEIRSFLIEHVSQTGGHLASNLGVVELTLAIHNVFDSEKDRILFDVGHQSYVHKILTGRKDSFSTLRMTDGLAGFPKPSESLHDAFTAGHASSAVSTALGIARARTLRQEDYHVVAVVGDGAMTGGLFYEGMNDAGNSHEPLIVILNDNGMSISRNVGGISEHLSLLRLKPGYFGFKKYFRRAMLKLPGGKKLYQLSHCIKEHLKRSLIHTTVFEEMGFLYYGPVDGHDIAKMSYLLARAKEEQRPVLLHVITKKGKGYEPAEQTPAEYHGVGSFDPTTGLHSGVENSFSSAFGSELCRIASRNPRVCAITAGMPDGTGLSAFRKTFPERFFDVGIAEGHAVSMAAGMAKQGLIPVFAVYSTFLQRAYDMILQDIALQKLHVVLCVDRAGLVGADGETHHGVFDISYLMDVPGMTVLAPASYAELQSMLNKAIFELDGPVAIRYPRGKELELMDMQEPVSAPDLTLVTYGTTVHAVNDAAVLLRQSGVRAEVIRLQQLKPLCVNPILASARNSGRVLVVEEVNAHGSVAEAIALMLPENGVAANIHGLNLGDGYTPYGNSAQLLSRAGLDAEGIAKTAMEVFCFGE